MSKKSDQIGLISIVPIKSGAENSLGEVLEKIQADLGADGPIPFGKLKTVHFIRWLILPEMPSKRTGDKKEFPPSLLLNSSFDGEVEAHLRELVKMGRTGIDSIYQHCEGYPEEGERTTAGIIDYLTDKKHRQRAGIFFQGHPGLSRERIEKDELLRNRIAKFLRSQTAAALGDDWVALREAIQDEIDEAGEPALRDVLTLPSKKERTDLGFSTVEWVVIITLLILLSPLWIPAVILLMLFVRASERSDTWDPVSGEETGEANLVEVQGSEDFIAQNQYTHVVEVKPGAIRGFAQKLVISLIHIAGRQPFIRRSFLNISTLHFVTWALIDDGRRVIFLSNYDGSAIQYIADFIDRSAGIPRALTGIWSNTYGFPRSRWLVLRGATDHAAFQAFLRDHQKPSHVWYSAYRSLTSANILNNAEIRRGLSREQARRKKARKRDEKRKKATTGEAREFLRKL